MSSSAAPRANDNAQDVDSSIQTGLTHHLGESGPPVV
jgi:hypothetical protein